MQFKKNSIEYIYHLPRYMYLEKSTKKLNCPESCLGSLLLKLKVHLLFFFPTWLEILRCVFFLLSCAWQVKKLCWPLLEMYVAERKWVLCTVNEGLLKSRICLKRFFTSLHPIILHNENRMNKTTENLSFW